jgi:hypothetical protein
MKGLHFVLGIEPSVGRTQVLYIIYSSALHTLLNLILFQNYPPLLPVLLLTSPVPYAHVLQIFLN